MKRKIRYAVPLIIIAVGVVILLSRSSPHLSDFELACNFYNHEREFDKLADMAREDAVVRTVSTNFVCLQNKEGWQPYVYWMEKDVGALSIAHDGFSRQRWDQYKDIFKKLNLQVGLDHRHEMPDAIFLTASIDVVEIGDGEAALTEKGYAYSQKEIHQSLAWTLDDIKTNQPGIFFKRLNDNWYLFYCWSVSKPE